MISYTRMAKQHGSAEKESIIRIPMEQAVLIQRNRLHLAKGYSLEESIHRAKEYISGALAAMLDLGKGSGPMDHGFEIRGRFGI